MFGLGLGEIVVVFLFILIFFGADSIPNFARGLGRFIRQAKDMTQGVQDDIMSSANKMRSDIRRNTEEFQRNVSSVEYDSTSKEPTIAEKIAAQKERDAKARSENTPGE